MKTIAISCDVSGGTQTLHNREDQESGSSLEDNLSDESDSNLVNLNYSDVENSAVPVEHTGLRPY